MQAAVEKAIKQGKKKIFYITGPTGWGLAGLLPKVDMVARNYVELFAEGRVEERHYEAHKNRVYEYIEGIDEWISENSELLLRAGLVGRPGNSYTRLYKQNIKQKRTMYLNTQIALNAYYCFVRCDALSTLMTFGLQKDAITVREYKQAAGRIFALIEQFEGEIEEQREFTCRCRR